MCCLLLPLNTYHSCILPGRAARRPWRGGADMYISLSLYIYIYRERDVYIYIYIHIHIHICIYTWRGGAAARFWRPPSGSWAPGRSANKHPHLDCKHININNTINIRNVNIYNIHKQKTMTTNNKLLQKTTNMRTWWLQALLSFVRHCFKGCVFRR